MGVYLFGLLTFIIDGFKLAAYGVKQGGIGSILAGGFSPLKRNSRTSVNTNDVVSLHKMDCYKYVFLIIICKRHLHQLFPPSPMLLFQTQNQTQQKIKEPWLLMIILQKMMVS